MVNVYEQKKKLRKFLQQKVARSDWKICVYIYIHTQFVLYLSSSILLLLSICIMSPITEPTGFNLLWLVHPVGSSLDAGVRTH